MYTGCVLRLARVQRKGTAGETVARSAGLPFQPAAVSCWVDRSGGGRLLGARGCPERWPLRLAAFYWRPGTAADVARTAALATRRKAEASSRWSMGRAITSGHTCGKPLGRGQYIGV